VTSTEPDTIDLYWRPGCGFCMNLDRQLKGIDLPIRRHNIWDDDDAAAMVRSYARGNETVPTVVIGDQAMVNPSARQVLTTVAESAPHLLPDDFEVPQPRLTRLFGRRTS
jgi:glutaredoxin